VELTPVELTPVELTPVESQQGIVLVTQMGNRYFTYVPLYFIAFGTVSFWRKVLNEYLNFIHEQECGRTIVGGEMK